MFSLTQFGIDKMW